MTATTISIGEITVQAIKDITTPARPEIMFPMSTPETMAPYMHYVNERGHFPVNIGTFAIRSAGKLILVDTGIGAKNRTQYRNGNLPENLHEAGIAPEDVDTVLITHLHLDHVGWNTIEQDGALVPFFPKARYVIVRREWEYFTQPEVAAKTDYIQDCVLPLQGTGQVDLIEDVTSITPQITTVPTPGHTPGHVAVALVSNGERGLIIGDVAHHPLQLTEWEWSLALDLDQARARETRRELIERVERERELVIGGHFPAPGFGRMIQMNGRRYWEALKPAPA